MHFKKNICFVALHNVGKSLKIIIALVALSLDKERASKKKDHKHKKAMLVSIMD